MENQELMAMPGGAPEEIGLADILILIWKRKWLFIICIPLCTLSGIIYAMKAPSVYHAEAIITLRESGKNNTASVLSQLGGGLGSIVGAQMNTGNNKLEWIQIIAKTEDVAEAVITKHNLLPKLFSKIYDSATSSWKVNDSSEIPSLRAGAEMLLRSILSVSTNIKTNVLTIGISTYNPDFAADLVTHYLEALRLTIQREAKQEADANSRYLEQKLKETADPWLREKIQGMIAHEIEKGMFTTSNPFQILKKPIAPLNRTKPKRSVIALFSLGVGITISMFLCFFWDFLMVVKRKMEKSKAVV